jgi:hypothetical protein
MEKNNPKALNLDLVRNSESNVTLGFKCPPELKLILAEEAENSGLTLSSYVCQLVNFETKEKFRLHKQNKLLTAEVEKIKTELKFFKNKHLHDLFEEQKVKNNADGFRKGKEVNVNINSEAKFFKNKHLLDLFEKQKGQKATYLNREGIKVNVIINSVEDVFELIINSFKYQQ